MTIRSHKDLRVWQKSMDLADVFYRLLATAAAIFFVASSTAVAADADLPPCHKPVNPLCLDETEKLKDAVYFDRCAQAVEEFVHVTERYTTCLALEHNEALLKAQKIAERLKCRAKRGAICF